jgi:RHS repeat-associated protein
MATAPNRSVPGLARDDRRRRGSAALARAEVLEVRRLLSAITFTGGSGNWNVASNWSPAQVPGGGDAVTIPAGATVDVTDGESALSTQAAAGSTIDISATGVLSAGTGTIAGTVNDADLFYGSGSASTPLVLAGTTNVTLQLNNSYFQNTGQLNLTGAGAVVLRAHVTNDGTVTVTGGANLDSGTFTNDAGHTIALADDTTTNGGTILNSGVIAKTAGTGASILTGGGVIEDYGGTVSAESGTLTIGDQSFFQNTTFTAAAGAAVSLDQSQGTETGNAYFSGTATGSGAGHLDFTSGTVNPGNPSAEGSTLTTFALNFPQGFAQVTGMTFRGNTPHLVNAGYLQFVGDAQHPALDIDNTGTIVVSGAGDLGFGDQTAFLNDTTGVIDLTSDAGLQQVGDGAGGSFYLTNKGLIEKTGGTGTSSIGTAATSTAGSVGIGFEDEGGTISAQTGTIDFPTGSAFENTTFTAAGGATISLDDADGTGNGVGYYFAGTLTGSGAGTLVFAGNGAVTAGPYDGSFSPTAGAILNFPAGFAQVTGMLFQGGGATEIVNQGTLDYVGAAQHPGMALDNKGTIDVTGTGDLGASRDGGFINDTTGVLDFQTDAGVTNVNGNTAFTNMGLIEKTGGAGDSVIGTGTNGIGLASIGGSYDVETGTLTLANGQSGFDFAVGTGTVTAGPGTVFAIGGPAHVGGDPSITGGGTFEVTANGTLYGPDNDSDEPNASPATLDFDPGTFVVTGGNLDDNSLLLNAGTIDYEGSSELDGIDNKGVITFDAGPLRVAGNIVNEAGGLLDFTAAQQILAVGNNGIISNAGSLVVAAGAGGTFDLSQINATNSGTFYVESGTLNLPWIPNQYVDQPGLFPNEQGLPAGSTFVVDPGATVTVDTAPTFSELDGTLILGGAGASFPAYAGLTTITGKLAVLSGDSFATAGNLTDHGTLSVGGSVTVTGALTLATDQATSTPPTPTLDFEVAAAPGAAGAPSLTVTGATTLAGDLTADYVDGFTGAGGAYTVATFTGGSSGSFASTSGAGPFFTPSVSAGSIVLNGTAFSGTGGSTPLPVAPTVSVPTPTPTPTPTSTPADLTVSAVTAPATFAPGSQQTITWTVTNDGTGAAAGYWDDSVFLSTDGALDASSVLVGRVTHAGPLAPGAAYAGTLMADMPGVVGSYTVLVETDSRGAVSNNVRTGGIGLSPAASTAVVPALTVGTPVTGTIALGQELIYSLALPAPADVSLAATFGAALAANLYVRASYLPTPALYDYAFASTTAVAATDLLHAGTPTTYYVLIYGRSAGATTPQAFTLSATSVTYGPVATAPAAGVNYGTTTVTVSGVGFTPSTMVNLVSNGVVAVPASSVTYVDANTLYATFVLTNGNPGDYDLQTTEGAGGPTASLPAAFHVAAADLSGTGAAAASAGHLVYSLSAPTYVRAGQSGTLTLFYENAGSSDIAAPLFSIESANATFQLAGQVGFVDNGIDVLGINPTGPAGVLTPGAAGQVTITFDQVTTGAHVATVFNAYVLSGSQATNWDGLKKGMEPEGEADDAWAQTYANFESIVGTTEAQYQAELDDVATRFGTAGDRTPDASVLLHYVLQVAGNFGQVEEQYAAGAFGRGQPDPYNLSLEVDADGNVGIGNAEGRAVYLLESNGAYVAGSSASLGTLTKGADGSYTLAGAAGGLEVYSPAGALEYTQDANGNRTTATVTNGLVTALSAADGDVTTLGYYPGTGEVQQLTDPTGRVTTYTYDADGNVLSVATPLGTTSYAYATPSTHDATTVTYADGSVVDYVYDAFGRLVKESAADGSDPVTFSYDDLGDQTQTDADGNAKTEDRGPGGAITAVVDAYGNVITATSPADGGGGPTSITGPDGGSTTTPTASAGTTATATTPGGSTASATYNAQGLPTTVTDPDGNTTAIGYDAHGNQTSVTDAAGKATPYTFDSQGNQTSSTTAAGRTVGSTYDARGLLTSQTFSDGTSASYTYNAHRDLTSATNAWGTETFTYDAADRLTKVAYSDGLSLAYTYNADGQVAQEVDQTGYATNYAYDALGELSTVTDATGTVAARYTYDAAGREARVDLGNGTYTLYTYDRDGRVLTIVNDAPDGTPTSSFAYQYDATGQITSMTSLAGTTRYGYDVAGELTSVTLPSGSVTTYGYDAAGNRTSVNDGGVTTAYATNDLNQYTTVGGEQLTYDADGNLTGETGPSGTTAYAYNALGELTSMVTPSGTYAYQYDALGNRVSTTLNGVVTDDLVDPNSTFSYLVGQYDANGAPIARYSYGLGLVDQVGSQGAGYYNFDLQGNTAAVTDAAGTVADSYTYLPFGQKLTSAGTVANPFTFDGISGVVDTGAGSYLTRYRLYDPALGRFAERDPTGLAGGDTNLYRYGLNNPVSSIDPMGTATYLPGVVARAMGLDTAGVISYICAQAGSGPLEEFLQNVASNQAVLADVAAGTASPVAVKSLQWGAESITNSANRLLAKGITEITLEDGTVIQVADLANGTNAQISEVLGVNAADPVAYADGLETFGGDPIAQTTVETTAGTAAEGLGGLVFTPVAFADAAFKYDVYYNQQFPDGTPVPTEDVLNANEVYRRILRDPLGAALLARVTAGGAVPSQNTLDTILQTIAQSQRQTQTQSVTSHDPNAITGPDAYGPAGFVPVVASLPYEVDFENAPTATAPAQTVVVTQTLDADLDLSTFQLGQIGFGSTTVSVPAGLQTYGTTVSVSASLSVQVTADLDASTGVVTWTFTSIDPTTGDTPSNPLSGFLPPDDAAGDGEGYVDYTVRPLSTLATGTTVVAQASIVFDTNAAIATPTLTDTIDAGPPTSTVTPLAATQGRLAIPVSWAGADDAGGSGIAFYTVLVSVDGGAFAPWLGGTTATSGVYDAQPGHTYAFESIATDHVGNTQATPATAQATTVVPAIAKTLTVSKGKPARFTDAAGRTVVVTLSGPGTGTLSFLAAGDADPVEFTLTGTTAATRVTVTAAGKAGTLSVGDVSVTGSLAAFTAATSDLVGSFAITGTLGSLSLDDAVSGATTVTIGGAGVATAIRFGTVQDLSLTTAAPIKSLSVASWTDGPAASDSLSAPSIGTLTVAGNFDPVVTLTGAAVDLRSAAIRGSVTGGSWTLTGSATTVSIRGSDAASLSATSVHSMQVGGNLSAATITLTATGAKVVDLATLSVTGTVTGSTVTAAAGVGTVTVGGMTGSTLYAGVTAGTTGLPTAAADLGAGGSIRSFVDRGKSPFADSDVAAYAIGTVTLSDVTTDDGGVLFGVAGHTVGTFALDQPKAKGVRFSGKKLTSTLDSLGGDLRVELL